MRDDNQVISRNIPGAKVKDFEKVKDKCEMQIALRRSV